jgi:DNA-binding CsgD family transcriptional regulator
MHPSDALTDSESRVARVLLSGSTNRETADRLFISVKTVETHVTRIYRKLGCRSRSQLIAAFHSGALQGRLTIPCGQEAAD